MIYDVNQDLCKWELHVKFPKENQVRILYMHTSAIATGYDIPAKDQYDQLYFVKLNKTMLEIIATDEHGKTIIFAGEANIVICDSYA